MLDVPNSPKLRKKFKEILKNLKQIRIFSSKFVINLQNFVGGGEEEETVSTFAILHSSIFVIFCSIWSWALNMSALNFIYIFYHTS